MPPARPRQRLAGADDVVRASGAGNGQEGRKGGEVNSSHVVEQHANDLLNTKPEHIADPTTMKLVVIFKEELLHATTSGLLCLEFHRFLNTADNV